MPSEAEAEVRGWTRSEVLRHWIRVAGADLCLPVGKPAEEEAPPGEAPAGARSRLAELAAEARACRACPLFRDRHQAVFADGDPEARILFVGEGPGLEEDLQGRPFVGPAGRLLTRIIEGAMGLPREAVYICNVVKCRPPRNRNPSPGEQEACGPFLEEQIRLVSPEIILALGRVAAGYLCRTELPLGRLRGEVHRFEGIPLVATWHPAYLLRNPPAKRETWEDIKLALRTLGLPEAPPSFRRPGD